MRDLEPQFELQELRGRWSLSIFRSKSANVAEGEESALDPFADDLAAAGRLKVIVFDVAAQPPPGHKPDRDLAVESPWTLIPLGPRKARPIAGVYHVLPVPELVLLTSEGRMAGLHLRGQKRLDVEPSHVAVCAARPFRVT